MTTMTAVKWIVTTTTRLDLYQTNKIEIYNDAGGLWEKGDTIYDTHLKNWNLCFTSPVKEVGYDKEEKWND